MIHPPVDRLLLLTDVARMPRLAAVKTPQPLYRHRVRLALPATVLGRRGGELIRFIDELIRQRVGGRRRGDDGLVADDLRVVGKADPRRLEIVLFWPDLSVVSTVSTAFWVPPTNRCKRHPIIQLVVCLVIG
jgi:hypothetical protein